MILKSKQYAVLLWFALYAIYIFKFYLYLFWKFSFAADRHHEIDVKYILYSENLLSDMRPLSARCVKLTVLVGPVSGSDWILNWISQGTVIVLQPVSVFNALNDNKNTMQTTPAVFCLSTNKVFAFDLYTSMLLF